jgi:hypothetical protein
MGRFGSSTGGANFGLLLARMNVLCDMCYMKHPYASGQCMLGTDRIAIPQNQIRASSGYPFDRLII